ncbi:MAG: glycosyltransferase family 39 protein [Anaerolineae bacterium]|nr:glycosyltransferase family 39 protein [Anaerolineae bacterium]
MTQTKNSLFRRRFVLLSALLTLLGSLYAFTYSGRIESNDMETLFDATSSLIRYGDTLLDESAWYNQPDVLTPASLYPLMRADTEPLPLILSAPLYLLASWLPGVGLAQTVWWFNTLVTLVTAAVVFGTAARLGYRDRTAVAATLLFGACTIYWPYTRTLFREPLAGLFILTAALCLETWRASQYRNVKALVGAFAAVGAGLLSKEAVGFALPALIVLALPPLTGRHRAYRLVMVSLLGMMLVFLVGLALVSVVGPATMDMKMFYEQAGALLSRSPQQIETIHQALHTYLLSIGASQWGTSPILLAVPIGLWLLWKQNHSQQALAILMMVVVFAAAYAVLRGVHWFGGLSWPPRFLVPIVPFVMLGLLPVLEWGFGQWDKMREGRARQAAHPCEDWR